MKSTSQLLATILISLALVNAAPVPSPQGSPIGGFVGLFKPLEQQYCKPGKNFKDPACPEYAAVEGATAQQKRQSDFSNVVPDTSSFPKPMSPIEGTLGSAGSLLTGSAPPQGSQEFPNLIGEATSVLDGTSGPAGKSAAKRQADIGQSVGGSLGFVGGLLNGGNGAVAVKRGEAASPSLNDLSELGTLGPALGGSSAVKPNGAFNLGKFPKRQLDGVLGSLASPGAAALKRQTTPDLSGAVDGVPVVGPLLSSLAPQPAAAAKRQAIPGGSALPVVGPVLNSVGSTLVPAAAAAPAAKRQTLPDISAIPIVGSLLGPKPAARQLPDLSGIPIVGPLVGSVTSGVSPAPAA